MGKRKIGIIFIILVLLASALTGVFILWRHQVKSQHEVRVDLPLSSIDNCFQCSNYPPQQSEPVFNKLGDISELTMNSYTTIADVPFSLDTLGLRSEVVELLQSPFIDHCGFAGHEKYSEHHTVCFEDVIHEDIADRLSLWRDESVEYAVFDVQHVHSFFRAKEEEDQFYLHIPVPEAVYYTFDDLFGYQYYFVYNTTLLYFHSGYPGDSNREIGELMAVVQANSNFGDLSSEQLSRFSSVMQTLFFSRLSPE